MPLDLQTAEPLKSWAQTVSYIVSAGAWLAAAAWFFSTNKFRRRIELDVEAKILPLPGNPNAKVLEIIVVLENKGFVDHKMRKLTVSVHALTSENTLVTKEDTGSLEFGTALLEMTNIVPTQDDYYFVRPGVRQLVIHIIPVDSRFSLLRITAGFNYDWHGKFPHTVRHIFSTSTDKA